MIESLRRRRVPVLKLATLIAVAAGSFALVNFAWAGDTEVSLSQREASSVSLVRILAIVAAGNPSIKAAEQRWLAMKARVPQAAAWEDLRLQGQTVTSRFVDISPNSFMDQSVQLQQELPLAGKNRSRARAATAEAGAAFEDLRRTQLDVMARARAAYYRLANEYAQLDVNRTNLELLNEFAKISRDRYEVGTAKQADVLVAETDAAKLLEAQIDISRRISEGQTALNVLMNRPAQSPLGVPTAMTFQPSDLSLTRLQAMAASARPEIQRAQNRVDAEAFKGELARRQRVPDPTLNVQAQRYNDTGQAVSELDVGFSVGLPFFNGRKYAAGITEADRNLGAAKQELDGARTEMLGLVRDQVRKVETAAHHYMLYRDKIAPLARQTMQSNRSAYEAGNATFLELITSQRVVQETESTYINHLADYEIARAELRAIIGADEREFRQSAPKQKRSR